MKGVRLNLQELLRREGAVELTDHMGMQARGTLCDWAVDRTEEQGEYDVRLRLRVRREPRVVRLKFAGPNVATGYCYADDGDDPLVPGDVVVAQTRYGAKNAIVEGSGRSGYVGEPGRILRVVSRARDLR